MNRKEEEETSDTIEEAAEREQGDKLKSQGSDPVKSEMVPNGRYRLRLRALRILGDPDKAEGYDYWITRTFTVEHS